MNDLDNPTIYASVDPSRMRDRLRGLPRQCDAAWRQAHAFPLPEHWKHRNKVIIGGMGGSAIAGDLVADLASPQKTVPIVVVRDFHLPFALDGGSLVLVCSYSGNTEETLSIFHEALKTEAQVMAISSGGVLAQEATAWGIPLITINQPGEPRSAVGFSVLLILGLLQRLGLVKTEEAAVNAAIEVLQQQVSQLAENVPTMDNPAKQLAMELQDKLIVVYGGGIFSGLARRWKTQFNENAKAWAFFELIPELLHNSIEASRALPGVNGRTAVLLLQPNQEEERIARRYSVASEVLRKYGISHRTLKGKEGPPLSQLLGMLLLGDYVSYYLALLNGTDPSPTPSLVSAKQRLSENLASNPYLSSPSVLGQG